MKIRNLNRIHIKNIYLPLFAFGIVLGTIFANKTPESLTKDFGMFDRSGIELLGGVKPDLLQLFGYVIRSRLKVCFFIVLCGLTKIAKACLYCMLLAAGFVFGALLCLATMQLGGTGFLVVLASVFPQGIFYVLSMLILVRVLYEGKGSEKAPAYGLAFLLAVAGVAAEVLLNPVIVRNCIYLIY